MEDAENVKHLGYFGIPPELLAHALRLPDGHAITHIDFDPVARMFRVFAEGPTLPEVKHGERVPEVMLVYSLDDSMPPGIKSSRFIKRSGR